MIRHIKHPTTGEKFYPYTLAKAVTVGEKTLDYYIKLNEENKKKERELASIVEEYNTMVSAFNKEITLFNEEVDSILCEKTLEEYIEDLKYFIECEVFLYEPPTII